MPSTQELAALEHYQRRTGANVVRQKMKPYIYKTTGMLDGDYEEGYECLYHEIKRCTKTPDAVAILTAEQSERELGKHAESRPHVVFIEAIHTCLMTDDKLNVYADMWDITIGDNTIDHLFAVAVIDQNGGCRYLDLASIFLWPCFLEQREKQGRGHLPFLSHDQEVPDIYSLKIDGVFSYAGFRRLGQMARA